MNRWSMFEVGIVAGLLSLGSAGSEATAQSANPSPAVIQARVQQSLVNLYFWGEADVYGSRLLGHGTGFVVNGL